MRFRYSTTGHWYKGNTHLHSLESDGKVSLPQLAQLYASAGYDFLFRSDHWVTSQVTTEADEYPLLWLDGIELNGCDDTGADYHVVCLGTTETPLDRKMGLLPAMESARRQGCLLILAHPHWCGNSLEDALHWNFDGVEVYNTLCQWGNGKGYGLVHWDAMLNHNPNTLAFAADDSHLQSPQDPRWNGGWLMVNAPACTREALLAAIRAGNYYASCGPAFSRIEQQGTQVVIETSPVRSIRLIGHKWMARRLWNEDGALLTEGCFEIPEEWPFCYLEIEDETGKRAWSNPLLCRE